MAQVKNSRRLRPNYGPRKRNNRGFISSLGQTVDGLHTEPPHQQFPTVVY